MTRDVLAEKSSGSDGKDNEQEKPNNQVCIYVKLMPTGLKLTSNMNADC